MKKILISLSLLISVANAGIQKTTKVTELKVESSNRIVISSEFFLRSGCSGGYIAKLQSGQNAVTEEALKNMYTILMSAILYGRTVVLDFSDDNNCWIGSVSIID